MSAERVERRLAAIFAADVAGYSRLMGDDEAGILARLRSHRRELIDPKVAEHKGHIGKTTGDGLLVRFWVGEPDISIEHCDIALRLSPRSRVGPALTHIGAAHFVSRRFDEAVPKLILAMQEDPSHPSAYRLLAGARAAADLCGSRSNRG